MLVIGLMSGTSADGVDAALVDWPDGSEVHPYTLLAFREFPFGVEVQERVHALAAGRLPAPEVLREYASLDVLLAERFAEAAADVAADAQVSLDAVRLIASHGQTVAHHPELKATLQIGDPSLIAERTGCTVVADFRPRDLAAGGEGAPLAPFFHLAALADPSENRIALNLGGIANLTWLPAGDPDAVIAFDVGPANTLVDGVVQLLSDGEERMDRDGRRALRGRSDRVLLARLMEDEYLGRPAPKSTGRERYGRAEAEKLVAEWRRGRRDPDDLLATLVVFTAESVALACRNLLPGSPQVDRVLVGGGGARNPATLAALVRAMPRSAIQRFDQAGVPADAAEAMAFSLMGRNALLGIPNHLPQCTGAGRSAVLGEFVPGRSGRI